MQAITGSIGLSLPSTDVGDTLDLSSVEGADLASGLGFLALFITQVNSNTIDPEVKTGLSDLLKGEISGETLGGKTLPQDLPLRSFFSEQNLQLDSKYSQILAGKDQLLVGKDQFLENKLFLNKGDEAFSISNLFDSIQEQDKPDVFLQSLIQELGSSTQRGKGLQAGFTGFAAITSQMGNQAWGDDLVSRVKWQIGQEIQEAKISLNPRELGPLQVKINIIDDQAHVQFVAHHGSVRDAIEDAIPRLREMLEQSGLVLADADVSQQSPDERQAFFKEAEDTIKESALENGHEEGSEHQVKVIRAGVGLVDAFI